MPNHTSYYKSSLEYIWSLSLFKSMMLASLSLFYRLFSFSFLFMRFLAFSLDLFRSAKFLHRLSGLAQCTDLTPFSSRRVILRCLLRALLLISIIFSISFVWALSALVIDRCISLLKFFFPDHYLSSFNWSLHITVVFFIFLSLHNYFLILCIFW